MRKKKAPVNRVGERHQAIVILSLHTERDSKNNILWKCKCDCGKEFLSPYRNVTKRKSCGCIPRNVDKYGAVNRRYFVYKRSAKNRNIEFQLTKDEFWEIAKQNCIYCGAEPTNWNWLIFKNGLFKASVTKGNHTEQFALKAGRLLNGIDRLDNNKGYTVKNSVPCCTKCNYMKSLHSFKDFIEHIKIIQDHLSIEVNKEAILKKLEY